MADNTPSEQPQASFRFLDLPRELRNMVYRHYTRMMPPLSTRRLAVGYPEVQISSATAFGLVRRYEHKILFVSKAVRAEYLHEVRLVRHTCYDILFHPPWHRELWRHEVHGIDEIGQSIGSTLLDTRRTDINCARRVRLTIDLQGASCPVPVGRTFCVLCSQAKLFLSRLTEERLADFPTPSIEVNYEDFAPLQVIKYALRFVQNRCWHAEFLNIVVIDDDNASQSPGCATRWLFNHMQKDLSRMVGGTEKETGMRLRHVVVQFPNNSWAEQGLWLQRSGDRKSFEIADGDWDVLSRVKEEPLVLV